VAIEPIASLDDARADWQALAGPADNPFGTWEWADAWWRAFGGGRRLELRRVHALDGRVAAILPLYAARRGPLTVLRFVGHGPADQLGPVCAPEDRPVAAAALRELAQRHLVLADRLPGEERLAPLLGGRVARREASPLVPLDAPTWDDWLAARSSNLRQQARRRERKLAREHGLTFRLTEDPGALDRDLEVLFALHEARWQGGSSAFAGPLRGFHADFARRALERGWLRLWIADLAGRPAAAWYGLRFGAREWYYQAGRDPAWERDAVGFALLVHTMRAALESGATEYRFGLGDEPYKARFATADPGLETVVMGRTPIPWLAEQAGGVAKRLPAGLRSTLARRAT
jgi:CelD/BcsL family acetyltransferase involved in cellulose biosynthesis